MALFGTDGARGVANESLTVDLAMEIARSAALKLERPARVLIGRDTRVSGPMLEAALAAGFTEMGIDVLLAGVVPTPALAYLISAMKADAGIMISASHNPPEYNGIKLLQASGKKWESADEEAVESRIRLRSWPAPDPKQVGRIQHCEDVAAGIYQRHVRSIFFGRVPAWPVVLDVGHGAASATAPQLFEGLGIPTTVINGEPLGELINVRCGATHPERLREAVLSSGAMMGLAFDGDADRVIAVDRTGRIVDGDEILYVLASRMKAEGRLVGNRVVATVMTNLGMERALASRGIELVRTPVGDRWVAMAMEAQSVMIGGEQSGHVILKEWTETGDGVLTGLALMAAVYADGLHLDEAVAPVKRYPQVLNNVRLDQPVDDWRSIVGLHALVQLAEDALGPEGRVLIRPSGTEPLLRIMLEGRDVDQINEWAHRLETGVRQALESAEVSRN